MKNDTRGIRKQYMNTIVLVAGFVLSSLYLCSQASALIGIKVGDQPRDIVLNNLNNTTVKVSDYFGVKPVVLVFWEQPLSKAFLDYSMDALHFLSDHYDTYHEQTGLQVFGIYTPEEAGRIPPDEITKVRNLIDNNKISFPILMDQDFKFFQEYGVIALPTTVMINSAGIVQFIYPSFPMSAHLIIEEQIKMLIGMAVTVKKEEVKGPDSKSGRFYRYALQMYKRGLAEQALSPLKKSLELDPEMSMSHNLLGVTLWRTGKADEALDEFTAAVKLDKDNVAAQLNHAVLLFEQEKYADMEEKLETLSVDKAEHQVRIHYMRGLAFRNTGNLDKAIEEIGRANSIIETVESLEGESAAFSDSYRVFLLRDLADLYSRKNNNDKTIEFLTKAVKVSLDLEGKSEDIPLHDREDIMLYE